MTHYCNWSLESPVTHLARCSLFRHIPASRTETNWIWWWRQNLNLYRWTFCGLWYSEYEYIIIISHTYRTFFNWEPPRHRVTPVLNCEKINVQIELVSFKSHVSTAVLYLVNLWHSSPHVETQFWSEASSASEMDSATFITWKRYPYDISWIS